jgi:hypothetical protein
MSLDSVLNDLILVSAVAVLGAVIARVVTSNMASSLKTEVERLNLIKGRVALLLTNVLQQKGSLQGVQAFYQRRKTEIMKERGLATYTIELYKIKEEELARLEETRQEVLAELEYAARAAREATDAGTGAIIEERKALATKRLEKVEEELETKLAEPVVELDGEAVDPDQEPEQEFDREPD